MKTKLISILAAAAVVCSCASNESDELLAAAERAFRMIPDHCEVSEQARPYMTDELFGMLALAWELPTWTDGEIGNEEFLWYFVTGQDSDTVLVTSSEIMSMSDTDATVRIMYKTFYHSAELSTLTLSMVKDSGSWKLDNFGDDVKSQCMDYMADEIFNYTSGQTEEYMLSCQEEWLASRQQDDEQEGGWYSDEEEEGWYSDEEDEGWYSDEHISAYIAAMDEFLDENPTLLTRLIHRDLDEWDAILAE